MNKVIKAVAGITVVLTLAVMCLFSSGASALALEDTVETGSITVSLPSGETDGTELTIFHVADLAASGENNAEYEYVLTDDFSASGVNLEDPDLTAAGALSDYASAKGIVGVSKELCEDGSVTFEGLPLGLYLVVETAVSSQGSVMSPFLVGVPGVGADGSPVYHVDATPKVEAYELIDVTVRKVWNDGGDEESRPDFVDVVLYDGDKAVDEARLSDENKWIYTWTGLPKSYDYRVEEELERTAGYVASVSQNGYTFTVTNTPKLVQSGQLNWPIPVLAVCGLLLFAAGWGIMYIKGKRDA